MEINPEILKIVRALALTENGGKIPDESKKGQSGELKSVFQFTPGTWKMYSKEVLGQEAPLTNENESAVAYGKVSKWLEDGFNPDQIASIWNSGKPDAYLQDHKGTNKYGVKYDTPGYVKKFNEHLDKTGDAGSKQSNQPEQKSEKAPVIQPAIQGNFAVAQPVASQQTSQLSPQIPSQGTPSTGHSIKQNKTLPQLLQKQIKPI